MPGDDDRAAALAGKFGDDVLHRDVAFGRLGRERILDHLAAVELELAEDVALQLMIRFRARRARPERDRLFREVERGRAGETRGARDGCADYQNQDRFRAEHIYPSVKLRRRSSGSNSGNTSAGGTRKSAARIMNGPGKNC